MRAHSVTAERVALMRAVHQIIDSKPPVFTDPLALRIIGHVAEQRLRANLVYHHGIVPRRVRSFLAARSCAAEEEVVRQLAPGPLQYVILGAGLDTFAYRRDDLRDVLTVYEVDHPDTQTWKHERLADAGIEIPPNLRYVPLDFNRQSLAERLAAAGFRRDLPAVFAWLGVMYYLPLAPISDTLRYAAGQDGATSIVFDFPLAESAVPPEHIHLFREFAAYNATAEERWQSWFTPAEIRELLLACGFAEIEYFDGDEIERRYLAGRPDHPLTSPLMGLVIARTRGR